MRNVKIDGRRQGKRTFEKSAHMVSLARMSIVLAPRSTFPTVAQGSPGQQCPPPSIVQRVTEDSSAH